MSELLPLILGVRRVPRAKVTAGKPDKSNAKPAPRINAADWPRLRNKVLSRDDFTCRYCGFRAEKFQRVHFRSGEQGEPTLANLATACIFCEQCFELESVTGMGSGMLIWLPELSQAELHHFVRAIYIARAEDNEISSRAQVALDQLMARRAEAKRRLGTDEVIMLASALAEHLDDEAYANRAERLDGIRLLPLPNRMAYSSLTNNGEQNQFPRIIDYWRSQQGPFGKYPLHKWPDLFNKTAA